jgi:hypothetical protein
VFLARTVFFTGKKSTVSGFREPKEYRVLIYSHGAIWYSTSLVFILKILKLWICFTGFTSSSHAVDLSRRRFLRGLAMAPAYASIRIPHSVAPGGGLAPILIPAPAPAPAKNDLAANLPFEVMISRGFDIVGRYQPKLNTVVDVDLSPDTFPDLSTEGTFDPAIEIVPSRSDEVGETSEIGEVDQYCSDILGHAELHSEEP